MGSPTHYAYNESPEEAAKRALIRRFKDAEAAVIETQRLPELPRRIRWACAKHEWSPDSPYPMALGASVACPECRRELAEPVEKESQARIDDSYPSGSNAQPDGKSSYELGLDAKWEAWQQEHGTAPDRELERLAVVETDAWAAYRLAEDNYAQHRAEYLRAEAAHDPDGPFAYHRPSGDHLRPERRYVLALHKDARAASAQRERYQREQGLIPERAVDPNEEIVVSV